MDLGVCGSRLGFGLSSGPTGDALRYAWNPGRSSDTLIALGVGRAFFVVVRVSFLGCP